MATVTAAICTYRGRPTAGSSLPLGTLIAEYTVAMLWQRRHYVAGVTLIDDDEATVHDCRHVLSREQTRAGSPLWRELTTAAIDAATATELRGTA